VTREVVHSILEPDVEAAARRLADAPAACGLVEIRADALHAGDVAGLVARAGRPLVVTVRTRDDGGTFTGSTDEKRAILRTALDAGAAFVDVEWDGPLAEFAHGPDAARVILSHHGATCDAAALAALLAAMRGTRAARLKIVPRARRLDELGALKALLARERSEAQPLAAFALGAAGTVSRVLALAWGSWATYGAAAGRETAEGQLSTAELLGVYRVASISGTTRRFGIAGSPVRRSLSPALHAAAYRATGLDAVYLPLDTAEVDDLAAVARPDGPLGLEGFGVTMPLKEPVAARCATLDPHAACGSVNTVIASGRWQGFNTDAPAALGLIGSHMPVAGAEVAVAGAGGTARAIAAALTRAGAHVTLYSRKAGTWDALRTAAWDVLVNATPLGTGGEQILPPAALTGRVVLDAAYAAGPTPLVVAARARGLAVSDGLDLLAAQAVGQFAILTGRSAPAGLFAAAAAPYRETARA